MELNLDEINLKILKIFQERGRVRNNQLAEEIGLSPAATIDRVKKIDESGYIQGFHAKLNPSSIGIGLEVLIQIKLAGQSEENIQLFKTQVDKIDEVIECIHLTGKFDFQLRAVLRDKGHLNRLVIHSLGRIKDIRKVNTILILSTEQKQLPIYCE